MAQVFIEDTNLKNIAKAIRQKNETTTLYKPSTMADAIKDLVVIPSIEITGNCYYRFSNDGWNFLLDNYDGNITTYDIDRLQNMFSGCRTLEKIPFSINCIEGTYAIQTSKMFQYCNKLKELPEININRISAFEGMFDSCYLINRIDSTKLKIADYSFPRTQNHGCELLFANCYSLRYIEPEILTNLTTIDEVSYSNTSSDNFTSIFYNCTCLDEIVNLGVQNLILYRLSFSSAFINCYRLKKLTFEIQEDGNPKSVPWDGVELDLSDCVGYCDSTKESLITGYNSGIKTSKRVYDSTTYNALKNDPDWYTLDANYSRYNHDSAVETINTLPIVPVSSSGFVPTIIFLGNSGAFTDGGAINTLTEEEVAVATAKNWTVSLV